MSNPSSESFRATLRDGSSSDGTPFNQRENALEDDYEDDTPTLK